jgi:hypothetical protein
VSALRALFRSERAAAAAEFALVLPIAILLMFGMIDVGRLMYILNRAEKATQIGARMAVVTNPVSVGLVNEDYVDADTSAGELIPADRLGRFVCTSTVCVCETGECPADTSVDGLAFNNIANRMDDFLDGLTPANVRVAYSGSGFGYAGDPPGSKGGGSGAVEAMEITPLVSVSLTGLRFRSFFLLGLVNFELPPFSSSLPAEDSSGQYSN